MSLINLTSPYLLLVRTAGLHRALSVTDLLQHTPAVLKSLSEQVLLLCDLRKQHSELVADIAQSIVVGALAPLAQLSSNRSSLLGSVLVGVDSMVLRLDQLVELLGKLGLLGAAQRGKREMRFAGSVARVVATL
jgi:hypothetical protein